MMQTLLTAGTVLAVVWALAYFCAPAWVWTVLGAAGLVALTVTPGVSQVAIVLAWILFAMLALLLNPGSIRRSVLTAPLLALFRKILPQMSSTEKEALDAGSVWWDGELFTGKPDWKKLLAYPKPQLSAEEQA